MKALIVVALLAAGAFLAWRKFRPAAPPAEPVSSPDKTPGANLENRMDNLSGAAPP